MAANIKFKEDALNLLKNNLEDSDLEATNLSLEGKMKCNFVKKSHDFWKNHRCDEQRIKME